jgi:hypothetical protein
MQKGQIVKISGRWYVRYREKRNINGTVENKRVSYCLGPVTTRGKHPPADIEEAAAEYMKTVNGSQIPAEHIVAFGDFVVSIYLPWVKETKKPSTYKGYNDIWEDHLKSVTAREKARIKDIRTFTVQGWLNQIGQGSLSRNSQKRIQSMLSGVFKQAKRLGFYDGINPVQDTAVSPHAAAPAETYAYAFAGLRRGEIEGLGWTDYRDGALWVSRSVQVRSPAPAFQSDRLRGDWIYCPTAVQLLF